MKVKFGRLIFQTIEVKVSSIKFSSAKTNPFLPTVTDITVDDLQNHLNDVQIIDVRRPDEWSDELGHIDSAKLIVLDTLPQNLAALAKDRPIVFVCRSGQRSANAAAYAQEHSFKNVFNLAGGMKAWAASKPSNS